MDRVARRGPLARAPSAKRGTLPKLSTFFSQLKGTLWREKILEKKVSQCRKKLKGGTLSLARYGLLRGKTGKTFLDQFARPNGAIIFSKELIWSVRVDRKKSLE